ncbi:hypothetical protein H0H92_010108 [Tricholoma furcatifolium]|nr:hypothetical protein H0H92_010108 [Tricholoma furcatifolium]
MRLQDFCLLFPLYLFLGSSVVRGDQILNNVTDTFIQQILDSWGVSGGVAVAVVRGDGQGNWNVETKGYGVATANGSQVTESTLFAMGSNSKLFNALATGLLLNNESISASWNAKIASLIPGWGLEDPFSTNKSAILDLLGHRTGMPRHDYSYKWSDSVPALIQKLQSQRASAEFRQVWQYNNNMYNTLSYLPTVLLPSKIPFARYVKEQIIDPLGLTSTTYAYDVAKLGHLADGFSRLNINYSSNPFTGTPKTFPFWTTYGGDGVNGEDGNVMSGAGGVISNAVDMATFSDQYIQATWLQMLLGEGLKPGTNTTIVSPDIIDTVASGITVMDAEA